MKLLFTIPANPHNFFGSNLIKGWLNYNQVFFDDDCMRMNYNTVYDFYDIYIYRSTEMDSSWDLLCNTVSNIDEVSHVDRTWSRDANGLMIDVIRFWIQCYSEEEEDPQPLPCPFCGSSDIEVDSNGVIEYTNRDEQLGTVECLSCSGSIEYTSKDPLRDSAERGAILRWNKRA